MTNNFSPGMAITCSSPKLLLIFLISTVYIHMYLYILLSLLSTMKTFEFFTTFSLLPLFSKTLISFRVKNMEAFPTFSVSLFLF